MKFVNRIKEIVLNGEDISKEQAIQLFEQPINELSNAANDIRKYFCGNIFDICTIINAKSGRCSENCKYCAQSSYYSTECDQYPLLSEQEIFSNAQYNADKGVLRYSLVTSGRNLNDQEVESICKVVEHIRNIIPIKLCGSFGLLNDGQYKKLYRSGLTRIHNNLETSKNNFTNVCTTHSFDNKVSAIQSAKNNGMTVCSGGIFGIGESIEDRIDLAFSLKELGIKSIPINLLNPVKGTPYENNKPLSSEDMCRIVAVFRFIIPDAFIRLAGGRGLLEDKGRSCFLAGANAAISGDMLTTRGMSIDTDMKMIREFGFEVKIKDE